MKKNALILIIILFASFHVLGQTDRDLIKYEKAFGGYRYTLSGRPVSIMQVSDIIGNNPETTVYLKKAKTNYYTSMVFNYAGGFMVGWPIGTAIGGGEPEWGLAAIGGGLILFGITFNNAANRNTIKAIDLYNSWKMNNGTRVYSMSFGLNSSGIGLSLKF